VRKPVTAAILFGGHLLLTTALMPSALATPAHPAAAPPAAAADRALHEGHHDGHHDDHYRCMYHCEERGYRWDGSHGDYYEGGHDRYYHGPEPYDRYGNGECWYHDREGWHRCGYHWRYRADAAPPS